MKSKTTQAQYQKRLDNVVEHIYEHLDENIKIDGLAEIACLSPYHRVRVGADSLCCDFPPRTLHAD